VPVKKIAVQDRGSYQLVVGGAGELGDLIDDFAETLGLAAEGWEAGLGEQVIRNKIKRLLIDFNKNEVAHYPPPYDKLLEFIICLKDKNAPDIHLWKASATGLRVVTDFALIGRGEDFYKPQVERLYRPDLSMPQAFLLGTYVLLQAKETINSIGGPIHSIGASPQEIFPVSPDLVQDLEQRVTEFNEALTQLVLACPDVSLRPVDFESLLKDFEARVMQLRAKYLGYAATALLDRVENDPNFKREPMPSVPPDTLISRGADGQAFILSPEETRAYILGAANPLTPPDFEEDIDADILDAVNELMPFDLEEENPPPDSQTVEEHD